jgi:hypothetical protein
MKRIFLSLLVLCLSCLSMAAQSTEPKTFESYFPRPYVSGGVSLMPNGYGAVAGRLQGGLLLNAPHAVCDTYVAIDNGKKTNDGTLNNIKGHDDYVAGFCGYKQGNWYFGGGMRWNELITSNYTKGTNFFQAVRDGDIRYQFGGGKDWFHHFSNGNFNMRAQVLYLLPPQHESVAYPATPTSAAFVCQGCGNGVQGPEITIWMPSPEYSKHWSARFTYGIYEFHTTITEPCGTPASQYPLCNPPDFKAQDNSRHVMGTVDMQVQYTFW